MSERLLLNVAEAAVTAGVGSTKIRAEIKSGRLPARKLGKLILLSIDDLRAWIDGLPRVAA
jgi:excisionase family DNA binding protein